MLNQVVESDLTLTTLFHQTAGPGVSIVKMQNSSSGRPRRLAYQ